MMQVLDSLNNLSDELCGNTLGKTTLALQTRVDLAFRGKFKDQVERIVVLIVIEKLDDVFVVQLVHNLDLKFDLLDKVMLNNFSLVDDFDSVDVLTSLMSHLVHFAEAANSNV